MADQTAQQARQQPNSYPSPHSYPSPSMQPTYTYPPPQGQSNPEPYRGSPQGSNMPLPSLNLPPIRMPDGQSQPPSQPPPQPQQAPVGSPLPPPAHSMPPQYYPHPQHGPPPPGQPMHMAPSPHNPNMPMRYQLPPTQDQRILSGGRHKKEIKRRTKTGCLTCRKRRIKCDEAHPICRNCQKSKRECMGYDPIFKQQPGPAQIQPAPNSAPHQAAVPASSAPPTSLPYGAQIPQGYAPAASAGYVPPVSASGAPNSSYEPNYGSAIDPALAAADPAMHGAQPPYNGAHGMNPALGGPNPYVLPVPVKTKRLGVNDIFAIGGHHPPEVPQRTAPISPELDEEWSQIFSRDYCLGLDAILETKWFSTDQRGLKMITSDKSLHEEAAHFAETIKNAAHNSYDGMARVFGQEARLIWHMLAVCKQAPPAMNGTNGTAPANAENEDYTLREVRARFDILEALLTYQTPEKNPAHQISYPPEVVEAKKAEIDFWEQLGQFVIHADSESPASQAVIDQALGIMRQVLQQIEARDVIYSFAIARHVGNRIRGFPQSIPPPMDQNPESELAKLDVAVRFIGHESRSSTFQVISRVCDMAQLSWSVSRLP